MRPSILRAVASRSQVPQRAHKMGFRPPSTNLRFCVWGLASSRTAPNGNRAESNRMARDCNCRASFQIPEQKNGVAEGSVRRPGECLGHGDARILLAYWKVRG